MKTRRLNLKFPRRPLGLWLLLGLGGVGLIGGLVAVNLFRQAKDEVWDRIRATGALSVVSDASYPPFSAVDADGNWFGFEVDLAEEIGRRWGVQVNFENLTYDALLGAVVTGRDDVVISAFVAQPERGREVAYTLPYFVGGTVAVIRSSGERMGADPVTWAAGKTLAVEYGAGGDALARLWARRAAGITVTPQPTAAEALQVVAAGGADAAVVDVIAAYDFLRAHPELKLAGSPLEPEPYVMAVNIRSRTLHSELQKVLIEMEHDGALPALRVKWFGEAAK